MANIHEHTVFMIQVEDEDGDDWHDTCLPMIERAIADQRLREMKRSCRSAKYHLIERTIITVEHIIS